MEKNIDDLNKTIKKEGEKNTGIENITDSFVSEKIEESSPSEKKAEIANLETQNEQTMKELNEAREGLPENENQNKLPRSVEENNEKIQKLNEEVGEGNQEEKEGEFRIERLRVSRFAETAQRLVIAFRERQSKGFSPVLSERELGRLSSGVTRIKDVISRKEYDQDDLDRELIKVSTAISTIGENLPPQRHAKDDPESLKRLMFNLRSTGEECRGLVSSLSKFPTEQTEKTRKILHKIVEDADKKRMFLAHKTDALMRMMGR